MRAWIAEGEHEGQDFKFAVSDPRKIARSISAFANRRGGRLLIGVKDNGVVAGVRNDEDAYVVELAASRYCHPAVDISFEAFSIDTSVTVVVANIPTATDAPVAVKEADGAEAIYIRVADSNVAAGPLVCQSLLMRCAPEGIAVPDTAAALTAFFAGGRDADPREAALHLHRPLKTLANHIAAMVATGLLRLGHNGHHFTLHSEAAPTEEADRLLLSRGKTVIF